MCVAPASAGSTNLRLVCDPATLQTIHVYCQIRALADTRKLPLLARVPPTSEVSPASPVFV